MPAVPIRSLCLCSDLLVLSMPTPLNTPTTLVVCHIMAIMDIIQATVMAMVVTATGQDMALATVMDQDMGAMDQAMDRAMDLAMATTTSKNKLPRSLRRSLPRICS